MILAEFRYIRESSSLPETFLYWVKYLRSGFAKLFQDFDRQDEPANLYLELGGISPGILQLVTEVYFGLEKPINVS